MAGHKRGVAVGGVSASRCGVAVSRCGVAVSRCCDVAASRLPGVAATRRGIFAKSRFWRFYSIFRISISILSNFNSCSIHSEVYSVMTYYGCKNYICI